MGLKAFQGSGDDKAGVDYFRSQETDSGRRSGRWNLDPPAKGQSLVVCCINYPSPPFRLSDRGGVKFTADQTGQRQLESVIQITTVYDSVRRPSRFLADRDMSSQPGWMILGE